MTELTLNINLKYITNKYLEIWQKLIVKYFSVLKIAPVKILGNSIIFINITIIDFDQNSFKLLYLFPLDNIIDFYIIFLHILKFYKCILNYALHQQLKNQTY